MGKVDDEHLRRIARLYRIPGVTAREVCERFGVTRYAVAKAAERFRAERWPWPEELVLSAVTERGLRTQGPWPDASTLALLASWVDYVNKDGSTAESIAAILDGLVQSGVLKRDGDAYTLLQPFP